MICRFSFTSCNREDQQNKDIYHVKVFYDEGKFGGWPANWGVWYWEEEVLVGFTKADHMERESHTYDQTTARAMFARSLDGGKTWSIEDGYDHGITEKTVEHQLGTLSQSASKLLEPIDFLDLDFAFTFRMIHMLKGPTSFYYSYDRGKNWNGAYSLEVDFGPRKPKGIVSRTDYIVDGKHSMTAFLTVGFMEGDTNWREVACVRTEDGGQSWKLLSWIGPEQVNSIMPGSVRLDANKLLCLIRRTKPPEMVSYLSEDNGDSWRQLKNPVEMDASGNPPALIKLRSGKLCLIYGLRRKETRPEGIGMYITFSTDEGQTWMEPKLLRGQDGAVWDIGYPRAVELPDGKVLVMYYYNHADDGDLFRYIAGTIFNPAIYD